MIIWKQPIDVLNQNSSISMPRGSKLLDIKLQNGAPVAWFEVPQRSDGVYVDFDVFFVGTGFSFDLPPRFEYVSTLLLEGDRLVFHFYVRRP